MGNLALMKYFPIGEEDTTKYLSSFSLKFFDTKIYRLVFQLTPKQHDTMICTAIYHYGENMTTVQSDCEIILCNRTNLVIEFSTMQIDFSMFLASSTPFNFYRGQRLYKSCGLSRAQIWKAVFNFFSTFLSSF